ncbi:MAG: heme biosynthesis protein HemY [Gammaproteobacteria bacterium]|nr:heme biosynthesis protein HemY [Gammaproteobacteria bacterium]
MRILAIIIVFVALAVAAGMFLREDPGYVFLGYGQWSVETSLAVFAVVALLLFALLYLALRTLRGLWRLPRRLGLATQQRAKQRAARGLTQGLIDLAEGRWERAERALMRDASGSENALLHYLGAARAAQQQGAHERRDAYLKRAIESNPQADIAVSLTQAELQLSHRQTERALASLSRLRNLAPKHDYVLRLLAKLYRDVEDWEHLLELLPEIARKHLFDDEALQSMRLATWRGILRAGDKHNAEELHNAWDALPKQAREHEDILHAYTERLIYFNAEKRVEPLLRAALNRRWSGKLARLYGLVQTDDAAQQLDSAEIWMKNHGRDPLLLLTLGRLCKRRSLWGKARIYLESSLGLNALAETHLELAELLESLGEKDGAMQHYREGLSLAVAAPRRRTGIVKPLPIRPRETLEETPGEVRDSGVSLPVA